MIAVDLSGLAADDYTGLAVLFGAFPAVIGLCSIFGALRAGRRIHEVTSPVAKIGHGVGTILLALVAAAPAYGAGWLFWTAHRGDYRPYAGVRKQARPNCELDAEGQRLTGAARSWFMVSASSWSVPS